MDEHKLLAMAREWYSDGYDDPKEATHMANVVAFEQPTAHCVVSRVEYHGALPTSSFTGDVHERFLLAQRRTAVMLSSDGGHIVDGLDGLDRIRSANGLMQEESHNVHVGDKKGTWDYLIHKYPRD